MLEFDFKKNVATYRSSSTVESDVIALSVCVLLRFLVYMHSF